jgi:hypothetical protein
MAQPSDSGQVLMDDQGVSLSTAIALLRSELRDALEEGEGGRLRFGIQSIELELEIAIKVTKKAEGKINLWKVLSFGGGRDAENAAKHRLKLLLQPFDTTLPPGAETRISDDDD